VTKVPLRRDGAHKPDTVVEVELERLPQMPIAPLRDRYRDLFKAEPPKAFGPDLLRRSIAYRIQENAYGGLARTTRRLLDQLVKAMAAKPNGRIELPRRIKVGAVLVREWKGTSHRVTVMADGFAYQGTTCASLSEIACLITGTKWSGPKFFGLRPSSKADPTLGESNGSVSDAPKRGRGRPWKVAADAPQTDAGVAL
jgi:hypothetical protein